MGAGSGSGLLASRCRTKIQRKKENYMAKGMTKTALVRLMAEKMEFTNKQTSAFLELLAETAVKETKKNGEFTIPGIGKLVKAERKARLGRNPQTGETIKIKAKTVVKFRVAKTAKDTIAPVKK
jgi:DNA-binding protein HU-beta